MKRGNRDRFVRTSQDLAKLSAVELVDALGARSPLVRSLATFAFRSLSKRLGHELASFDNEIATNGLHTESAALLARLRVRTRVTGALPKEGPLLVFSNHPGAYDALSLFSSFGRDDISALAADRPFLRALPNLARRIFPLSLDEGGPDRGRLSRAGTFLAARGHLARGGALLHFPAGRIEPDPAFADDGLIGPWHDSTYRLLRVAVNAGARIGLAIVAGVHSPQAKRLALTRAFEARGITTFGPLLQVAFPSLAPRTLTIHVREIVPPKTLDASFLSALRGEALAIATSVHASYRATSVRETP